MSFPLPLHSMPSRGLASPAWSLWGIPTGAARGQQLALALLRVAGACGIAHPSCMLFEHGGAVELRGVLGGDWLVADVFAHDRAVFALTTKALSPVRCARDLVNSATSSLFRSFVRPWVRNSEPLSE